MTTSAVKRRPVRSFVLRQGRLTVAQSRALHEIMPQYGVTFSPAELSYDTLFGRSAPTILEIGFGMGQATASIAAQCPQNNYLAIEVHAPGVGSLLLQIEQHALSNLRIIQHDAVEVLRHMVADGSLDGVHVFFPDPWHKARHHKRRLIQPDFVALLVSKLKPGGYVHLATDWLPYAEHMLDTLRANPQLANTGEDYVPRPDYRPLTKFEQRGLRLGHAVRDLVFIKTHSADVCIPQPV